MISTIVSRLVILLFGTLYPAYASYKAVRTKNVKEYVKWMMYWIVFALFTCAETFTDVFLSFWFPFYYEIKIIIVIWLLSPATKGSSILYRKFVHPMLCKREQEIDEYISRAREQGYHTMLHLGSKGVTYATTVIMQTAIKGGGGIVNHLRRSYSLSDLSTDPDLKADVNRNSKALPEDTLDAGDLSRDLRLRAARKPGGSHVDLYFPEMDVDVRSHGHHSRETSVILNQIRSSEDISSGYSSADGAHGDGSTLLRTASVGAPRRGRGGRGARSRRATTEDVYQDFSAHELIDFGTQHFLDNSYPLAPLLPVLMSQDITSHNKTLTTELLNLLQNALNKEAVVISNILDTKDNANNFPMDDICLKEEHVNYENSKAEKVDSETCIDGNACAIISQSVEEKDVDTVVTLNLKDEHTESSSTTVVACVDDVDKFDETQYEAEITREKTVDNFGSCHNSKQVDNVFSETDDPKAEEMSYEHIYSLSDDSELFVDAEGEDVCITEETQTEQPDEFQDKNVELINENTITESGELKIKKESVFHEDHLLHVEDAESVASSTDDQSNCGDTENLDNKDRKFRKGKYHKLRAPLPPASRVTIESCNNDGDKKLENKSTTVKISDCYTNVNCSLKNKTEQLRREFFSNDNKTQDIVIASNFVPDEALGDESFREHENFTKSDSRIELKTSSDVHIHKEKTSCTPKLENKGKSKLNIFSSVKKILHKNEETTENNPDSVLIPLKGNCETETNFKCEDNTGQDKVMIRQMSSSPSQKKRFLFN